MKAQDLSWIATSCTLGRSALPGRGCRLSRHSRVALRDVRGGDGAASFSSYETVIQNLRLIRGRGINVWPESNRRWSEAAIGLDYLGRILFLFCRAPFTMRDFNEQLARLPLGIVRAMHVEGGPEASLSVRGPDLSLDLAGSYETGFNEGDDNGKQWPLPNVLVVERRMPADR